MSNELIIYKYDVDIEPFSLKLPKTSDVLCVQVQNNQPRMWVLQPVDDGELVSRTFITIPTGRPFPNILPANYGYVGTFQLGDGALVYHLIELF